MQVLYGSSTVKPPRPRNLLIGPKIIVISIIDRMSAEDATNLVRGDPETPHVVQLEILPGMFNNGGGAADFRYCGRLGAPFPQRKVSNFNSDLFPIYISGLQCRHPVLVTETSEPCRFSRASRQCPCHPWGGIPGGVRGINR